MAQTCSKHGIRPDGLRCVECGAERLQELLLDEAQKPKLPQPVYVDPLCEACIFSNGGPCTCIQTHDDVRKMRAELAKAVAEREEARSLINEIARDVERIHALARKCI